ncbi:efflux RND transporter permease subunit [Methylopila sp. M107]|uniref:efflux RND transporter permease subunit n=1 Tax=Methylopila sp. M107 TaxID=1101190 RepID=UPI000360EBAB|nr:efflux RND transporter permease subunit [Methylopila sp. M107]
MSRFFIARPVFAWVLAIAVMLFGVLAIRMLPISQYPEIVPTTVKISATYSGADAATIENTVTKVIEQGMTGIDNLDYMTSSSTYTGSAQISLVFTSDADPDIAQVQVQNKLQLVESSLPQTVRDTGVTVTKSTGGFLMVAAFVSTDGKLSSLDLSDYVESTLNDTIQRSSGVGETQVFGSAYAMRIWLDPAKLQKYALMPSDVTSAITAQNAQVAAGQLGGLPQVKGQKLNATVTAKSQLQTPRQFENIILKSESGGSIVRVNDVARVELGAQSYTSSAKFNGKPAAGLAISLASGANALDTAQSVKNTIERLKPTFPQGVDVVYPYDTTPFVKLSIEDVVKTLIEAIVLVFVVMLVFLQNLRATLIPTLAVPVVLLGVFAALAVAGYSINTLTMFAMVLAIGLLVDDAIVVVENVERVMEEEGLGPREATLKSMGEITGALVGIALVLSAVFVPMAFFSGSVGIIYRQFSVTIVTAMLLSAVVALIFTPALCATLLKPKPKGPQRGFAGWFNRGFDRMAGRYAAGVGGVVRRRLRFLVVFALICGGMAYLFARLPSSFLPEEDQGLVIASVTTPVGATQDRTEKALDQVREYFLEKEKDTVEGVFTTVGFNFGGQGQNVGLAFVRLKDFAQRGQAGQTAQALLKRATAAFSQLRDAQVFAMTPPAIPGFGNNSGFEFYLQDVNGAGHEALVAVRNSLLAEAAKSPKLVGVRPNGMEDTPQYQVDVDEEKASAFDLSLADVDATLSTAWGGSYVNDFIDRGRVKQVYVQSDAQFRMQPDQIGNWYVRNSNAEMVPFSTFATGRWTFGSPRLDRFNGSSAIDIQGAAAPGVSSGDAMAEADRIVAALPPGYAHQYTGLSHQELLSDSQAGALYAISVLVVFLCLAALYESWSVPFAVMLAVPIGVFGALGAATLLGQSNDVYFKVGLLTTIGLAAKNAILIVEFAIERQAAGMPLVEATIEAARQRLRPILMTSFAFILGVTPLAIAHGAGSGAQNSIGIGVMGGMIAATGLGVFFVPLLYVAIRSLFPPQPAPSPAPETAGA